MGMKVRVEFGAFAFEACEDPSPRDAAAAAARDWLASRAPIAPVAPAAKAPETRGRVVNLAQLKPRNEANGAPEAAAQTDGGSASSEFAEFAEAHGARSIEKTVEAAAAHLTLMQGRQTFRRPRLIRTARLFPAARDADESELRHAIGVLREGGALDAAQGGLKLAMRVEEDYRERMGLAAAS